MKKYYLFLPLILLCSIFLYIKNPFSNSVSAESMLIRSFSYLKAQVVSSEIHLYGEIDRRDPNNLEQLKSLAADLSEELGILNDNRFSRRIMQNDLVREIQVSGVIPAASENLDKVAYITISSEETSGKPGIDGITVDILQGSSLEELEATKKLTEKLFKKYRIKPTISLCITGNFEGKLNRKGMDDICRTIFLEAGASKIKGKKGRDFISVTAYSPSIDNFVKMQDDRVNLDIVFRYNLLEDRTYLWLAIPVVSGVC